MFILKAESAHIRGFTDYSLEPENPTGMLTREDGSSLKPGEIAEFRVYYRLRHQESFRVIRIESPSTTRLSLAEMAPGAYEFAITTVDNEGLESRRSAPVTVDLI
jgi:fibronectin type 3 domain-containing protein